MCQGGFIDCMNYEFNLLHHVGVVAKRLCAAAAETEAHKGEDNTPSGPTGKNCSFQKSTQGLFDKHNQA